MAETTHIDPRTDSGNGIWEPRRTLTLEAARRHSQRVRFFQFLLMALAVFTIAVLVWEFTRQATTVFPETDPGESVKMVNPRYSGRTDDGLPFYLTAKEAIRLTADQETVQLVDPVLEFFRVENAGKSIVIAETGTYNDIDKVLELRTSVDLKTDDGYICLTTHARVFTKTKVIEGDEPIDCVGEFGKVNGNAYEIVDNYATFIFKNGMTALLDQEQ